MDYGYYLQYTEFKKICNKNPHSLLFALRFMFSLDEFSALKITESITRGERVDPDLIRNPEIFWMIK